MLYHDFPRIGTDGNPHAFLQKVNFNPFSDPNHIVDDISHDRSLLMVYSQYVFPIFGQITVQIGERGK